MSTEPVPIRALPNLPPKHPDRSCRNALFTHSFEHLLKPPHWLFITGTLPNFMKLNLKILNHDLQEDGSLQVVFHLLSFPPSPTPAPCPGQNPSTALQDSQQGPQTGHPQAKSSKETFCLGQSAFKNLILEFLSRQASLPTACAHLLHCLQLRCRD